MHVLSYTTQQSYVHSKCILLLLTATVQLRIWLSEEKCIAPQHTGNSLSFRDWNYEKSAAKHTYSMCVCNSVCVMYLHGDIRFLWMCAVFLTLQSSQARIASLYLPLLTIVIENKSRLQPKDCAPPPPGITVNGDALLDVSSRRGSTLTSYTSQISLDQASLASGISSVSQQQRPTVRDPNVFSLISGQG